ncbi:hypothetical protein JYT83_00935 [bacterium AH-315-F18]|nr:hypothetical protein [bacterium AH-315-F18]
MLKVCHRAELSGGKSSNVIHSSRPSKIKGYEATGFGAFVHCDQNPGKALAADLAVAARSNRFALHDVNCPNAAHHFPPKSVLRKHWYNRCNATLRLEGSLMIFLGILGAILLAGLLIAVVLPVVTGAPLRPKVVHLALLASGAIVVMLPAGAPDDRAEQVMRTLEDGAPRISGPRRGQGEHRPSLTIVLDPLVRPDGSVPALDDAKSLERLQLVKNKLEEDGYTVAVVKATELASEDVSAVGINVLMNQITNPDIP